MAGPLPLTLTLSPKGRGYYTLKGEELQEGEPLRPSIS